MGKGKKTDSRIRLAHRTSELLEPRCLLSAAAPCATPAPSFSAAASQIVQPVTTNSTTPAIITPGAILSAQGIVSATGAGQTIAVVEPFHDPNLKSDLATFDAYFGIASPKGFVVVSQSGGSASQITTNPQAAWHEAADVEWAHALAPQANILVVEATDASTQNLSDALDYARNAIGVSVVTLGWADAAFLDQAETSGLLAAPSGHGNIAFVVSGDWDAGAAFGSSSSSPSLATAAGSGSGGAAVISITNPSPGNGTGQMKPFIKHSESAAVWSGKPSTSSTTVVVSNPSDLSGIIIYDSIARGGTSGWQSTGDSATGAGQWGGLIADADQLLVAKGAEALGGLLAAMPTTSAQPTIVGAFDSAAHSQADDLTIPPAPAPKITSTSIGSIDTSGIVPAPTEAGGQSQAAGVQPPRLVEATALFSLATVVAPQGYITGIASGASTSQGPLAGTSLAFTKLPARSSAGSATGSVTQPSVESSNIVTAANSPSIAVRSSAASFSETAVTLASWLAGSGGGDSNDWVFSSFKSSKPAGSSLGFAAVIAGESAQQLGVVAKHMAATMGEVLAPVPAQVVYRFAQFDPAATFSDVLADFAHESASLSVLESRRQSARRAWAITGAVIVIDAMMAARWYFGRKKVGRNLAAEATISL